MPSSLSSLQDRVTNKGISVRILQGTEIEPYLEQIALARINFFKEYPYLYKGTLEYEMWYLKLYKDTENARIIIGEKDGKVVGFTTGVPLTGDHALLKELSSFFDKPEEYYYLGETIINPEYRGLGASSIGMRAFEQVAALLGYPKICFIEVEREKDHPLRPKGYRDIDPLMKRLGYQKTMHYFEPVYPTFQADGSVKDVPNKMAIWVNKE